ncbi:glycosyltransferase family 4 protein [uncultured Prevotella sp.]|uniref:glycosyltransferase family 4 protein n=1 Tax=uncultured Prevotella sp. TaxID=159272 RepID=UPI002592C271|nr:glycosyltransferase family 4 protein [uncultured Prevotella sp.]
MQKKKLIRVTTHDISLDSFLEGQLRFLSRYYDVVGVAKDTGVMERVRQREGVRCIDVPMEREISLRKDVKALYILYKLFRKEKPWMVHSNTPKGSLLSMIAAWAARVPRRVYLVTGLRYQGAHGLLRTVLKTMERITCSFATNVIPEGQGVLHTIQADHITRKPLKVIHFGNINGKNTTHLSRRQTVADNLQKSPEDVTDEDIASYRREVRRRLGFADADFVFVFVGRIVADKGMTELAQAMRTISSRHPNARLLLVGTMEKGDAITDDVHDYFLSSKVVKYVGSQKDVRPYLIAADTLAFPSYREGFPNVPMEAGAMNLPCIVTDINGSNEIIRDGLNGKIIVAPLDAHGHHVADITPALTETMEWFILHPAEVQRMSRNARRMIKERYEQRDVWNGLLAFYNELKD